MKKAFVFSKTNWSEPPRIRHDFVSLLIDLGFMVWFFEKPIFMHFGKQGIRVQDNLVLCSQTELLHHQVRFLPALTWLNKVYQCHFNNWRQAAPDLLVNFNYDYYWLKNEFGDTPLMTVINDDFIGRAKPWMKREARRVFERTVSVSDICLAVSLPVLDQCKRYNTNSHLFLPWIEVDREIRLKHRQGTRVLYWGFINNRIDWKIIDCLLGEGVEVDMIGPIEKKATQKVLLEYTRKGLRYRAAMSYDELKSEAENYYAAILAYRLDLPENRAISASNRFFKILAMGIPIVVARLPYLVDSPNDIVYTYIDCDECLNALAIIRKKSGLEKRFESFISNHTDLHRRNELISLLRNLGVFV